MRRRHPAQTLFALPGTLFQSQSVTLTCVHPGGAELSLRTATLEVSCLPELIKCVCFWGGGSHGIIFAVRSDCEGLRFWCLSSNCSKEIYFYCIGTAFAPRRAMVNYDGFASNCSRTVDLCVAAIMGLSFPAHPVLQS